MRMLDPNALTIGFARRFASYKRPNLLLRDQDRLLRLLGNPQRPVQLIIAGKAHPADQEGQAMVSEWLHFIRHTAARTHVVYLSDYDMLQASQLVQGVDLWLNTPRRPWEACGTSGMKILANGGLNLSELDGWWAEAYRPEIGWALGDGQDRGEDASWDAAEAEALFNLLEREVVPAFYERDPQGVPQKWLQRLRESMAQLTLEFSANRAVREYAEKYYLPAAAAYRERSADRGRKALQFGEVSRLWESHAGEIRFGLVSVSQEGSVHAFEAQVYLDGIDPSLVQVELYADPRNGCAPFRQSMELVRPLVGASGGYVYAGQAPASRPAPDYTPRLRSATQGFSAALEAPWIVWSR